MQAFLVPQVHSATTVVATGASEANTAIPNNASGEKTAYLMLRTEPGEWCKVLPIASGTPAGSTFMPVTEHGVILNVKGMASIRHIEGSTGANLYLTPLENQ